jgi:hypothetical protein
MEVEDLLGVLAAGLDVGVAVGPGGGRVAVTVMTMLLMWCTVRPRFACRSSM